MLNRDAQQRVHSLTAVGLQPVGIIPFRAKKHGTQQEKQNAQYWQGLSLVCIRHVTRFFSPREEVVCFFSLFLLFLVSFTSCGFQNLFDFLQERTTQNEDYVGCSKS